MTKQEREKAAKLRPSIIRELEQMEKRYGEATVSSAYNRHRQIRSEGRKLLRQRRVIEEKIRKLKA